MYEHSRDTKHTVVVTQSLFALTDRFAQVESGECHDPMEASAYCNSQEWKWVGVNDHCHLHYMPPSEVKEVLKG